MDQNIKDYIAEKAHLKAYQNKEEFISKQGEGNPSKLNVNVQNFQRSVIAVDNAEGPPLPIKGDASHGDSTNEYRVSRMESILKIAKKDMKSDDILIRIKILEDKILWIEEHYPQVALACFDYTQDKSQEKKGRVAQVKQYYHPKYDNNIAVEESIGLEMLKRLEELKYKLQKK